MPIYCLNLLLMYRLKEGALSPRRRIDYPFSNFFVVGNKRIVLKIAGSFQVLTATWLGRELVAGREGCSPRSSQKFYDPYERFTC